jgi:hypothetical protein
MIFWISRSTGTTRRFPNRSHPGDPSGNKYTWDLPLLVSIGCFLCLRHCVE